jgi:hypothetical protein
VCGDGVAGDRLVAVRDGQELSCPQVEIAADLTGGEGFDGEGFAGETIRIWARAATGRRRRARDLLIFVLFTVSLRRFPEELPGLLGRVGTPT